ncbi:MAG: hypothetical protein ACLS5J_10185 [Blautia sp.]
MNEPQCFVGLGFLTGEHAPGVKAPLRDTELIFLQDICEN